MNKTELKAIWEKEEKSAHIHGWDFSHINGRFAKDTALPWDYEKIIKQYLKVFFWRENLQPFEQIQSIKSNSVINN